MHSLETLHLDMPTVVQVPFHQLIRYVVENSKVYLLFAFLLSRHTWYVLVAALFWYMATLSNYHS